MNKQNKEMVNILQKADVEQLHKMSDEVGEMYQRIIDRLTIEGIEIADSNEAVYFSMLVNSFEQLNQFYNY